LASGNLTNRKKGRSKKAAVLIQELKDSTAQFIKQGTEIANENPEMKDELMNAVNDVRIYGDKMANSSKEFTNDPFTSQKRVTMVGNARELLTAVARLLTIADMIDVHLLIKCINQVSFNFLKYLRFNNLF
jgi:catenin alpha